MSAEMTRFDFKQYLLTVMEEADAEKAAFVARQVGLVSRDVCSLCEQEDSEPLTKFWSKESCSFYLAHEGCKDSVEMGWGEEVETE